jgi:ribulose-bisphosphate carboxylase small chain
VQEPIMRLTESTFSFLPELGDEQILREIARAMTRGWALSVEHTRELHPRSVEWELWGAPMLGASRVSAVMDEVKACRVAFPDRWVKLVAFDPARGCARVRLALFVQRPPLEPGFELVRQARQGRRVRYTVRTVREPERSAS